MGRKFSLHEDYLDEEPVAGSSDRSFGCTVGTILIAIGTFRGWMAGAFTLVVYLTVTPGIVLLALGVVAPWYLTRLNHLWQLLGAAIAVVVNPIVLGLLFYLVFTPMAVVLRLVGKRPLRLPFDPAAPSYWLPRPAAETSASDMRRQF